MNLEFRKATLSEAQEIHDIVEITKNKIYPYYYPDRVVSYFSKLHNLKNIENDIRDGKVFILLNDNKIVGTGSFDKNRITRVYILPEYQSNGFGSLIMEELEKLIFSNYDSCELDASLPASIFYENRGYQTKKHVRFVIDKNPPMVYEIMEKYKPNNEYN